MTDKSGNRLILAPHPFTPEPAIETVVPYGLSLAQLLEAHGIQRHETVHILVNGRRCADLNYCPQPGESILVAQALAGGDGGGKSVFRMVAMIAITVAAVYTGGVAASAFGWGAAGKAAAVAGLSMVGQMAFTALIPPPELGDRNRNLGLNFEQSYSFNGQSNAIAPWQPVYRLFGRLRMFPVLASQPLVDNVGTESWITAVYDFGSGDIDLSDIRIGETAISQYTDDVVIYQNSLGQSLRWHSDKINYQPLAISLQKDQPQELNVAAGATSAQLTLAFPGGLIAFGSSGEQFQTDVVYIIHIDDGAGGWTRPTSMTVSGMANNILDVINGVSSSGYDWSALYPDIGDAVVLNLAAKTLQPVVARIDFAFTDDRPHTIKIMRIKFVGTGAGYINRDQLTMLRSTSPGSPLTLAEPHTLVECRIRATDQLNGVVQNLSAVAHSKLRTYDGSQWQPASKTRNPAWIALEILTGASNARPLNDSQLDLDAWKRLADYCDEQITTTVNGQSSTGPRFQCDLLVDFDSTVNQLVNSILSQCHATLKINNAGQYSVLIDQEQSVSRQLITPANSWQFSGERTYGDAPHGLRVKFVNENLGYEPDVCIVYADNYSAATATEFEELETVGVTEYAAAWRYGRYMLAQGTRRSELFTVMMDAEYLAAGRGDRVSVQHDVPRHGGMAARIVSISGADLVIDAEIVSGSPNAWTARLKDGTVKTGALASVSGDSVSLAAPEPGLNTGDLICFGESQRVTHDYLITKIEPAEDLTARVTLVKYEPAIYTADTGTLPEWNPGIGSDYTTPDLKITGLTAAISYQHIEREPTALIDLGWSLTGTLAQLDHYDIYARTEGIRTEKIGESSELFFRWDINTFRASRWVADVEIEVVPISRRDQPGQRGLVAVTVQPDTNPPSAPEYFNCSIQSGTADLFWFHSSSADVYQYELRYSPAVSATAADFGTGQTLALVDYKTNRITVGARLGSYFIRALDISGNASPVVVTRSAVEDMPDIDIIIRLDDCLSGLTGNYDHDVLPVGNTLKVFGPTGWYQFSDLFDQGEIYEVRLVDLSSARLINTDTGQLSDKTSDWEMFTEYRSADSLTVMSDWQPLSSVTPNLSQFVTYWTPWRRFDVADVTGRFFEFRATFSLFGEISEDYHLSVTSLAVEIDVVENVQSFNDYPIPSAGTVINWLPAFRDVPTVTATLDNAAAGDQIVITNKTRSGCNVAIINSGTPKAGQVDIIAVGYGRQRSASI